MQRETIQYDTVRSTARSYKYLDALTTAFVVILLVSNLIAQKPCFIGTYSVSAAMLQCPITYIFRDVLTEDYGYAASRLAITLGFIGTSALSVIDAIDRHQSCIPLSFAEKSNLDA